MKCIVCGGSLKLISDRLNGHISGCPGGVYPFSLVMCSYCGLLQKGITQEYKKHIDYVYKNNYTFFTQEQNVLNGGEKERCEHIINAIVSIFQNKPLKWLDYGCGGGHFLHLLSTVHPEYYLYGYDVSDVNKDKLLARTKLNEFYLPDDTINEKFDVISINMVLEHLFDPSAVLVRLSSLLSDNGRVIIRVPDFCNNLGDLLIYEHTSHYSLQNLKYLLSICGLELEAHIDGVPNVEFAVIARKCDFAIMSDIVQLCKEYDYSYVLDVIKVINAIIAYCDTLLDSEFAFFGTSGLGAFLANYFLQKVTCMVDEDEGRQKMKFANLGIISPGECRVPILVAFRNRKSSKIMVAQLKERYPNQTFIDLFTKI